MRTFLLLCIFALVGGLFAGCGGSPGPTPQPSQPTAVMDSAVRRGEVVYAQSCVGCHGPRGEGLPNLGKNLTTSEFLASKNDKELIQFIKTGRPVTDPLNTTGIAMPPMNENMGLTDDKLQDLVAYLRWAHE